ncbi:HPF/RaiA family ribosome-associated protein [Candidatus Saccharibacteria bacterium]|nr:HPF/RaiA family ribosome-associated protein [Candidatus Saccharibacteria bacterium]
MGNISSKNYQLSDKEKTAIRVKVAKIIGFLPRHAKKSADMSVNVERAVKGAKKINAEIILKVPGKKDLVAKANSERMIDAFELAENKIKRQIHRYKDETKRRPNILRRLLRKR